MESSGYIFLHIAIIIIIAQLSSYLMMKIRLPSVLGMLIVGILIGPSFLDLMHVDKSIKVMSEIGVILLLFQAGVDTDIKSMKKNSRISFLVAGGGVLVPLIGGLLLGHFTGLSFNNAIVLGVILTATSVSVTVRTLMDMRKLKTFEGSTIISSAIIDDVMGILLLTFVFAFLFKNGSVLMAMLKIMIFVVEMIIIFFITKPVFIWAHKTQMREMELSFSVAFMLIAAYLARIGGLADITGAFFAGLFIGNTHSRKIVEDGIEKIGESLFVPIFFMMIGMETNLRTGSPVLSFTVWLVIIAILSKFIGTWGGSVLSGINMKRSARIGAGMIPRGEVGLVVANIALAQSLITTAHFASVIIMVIITSIVTPFMLKLLFKEKEL